MAVPVVGHDHTGLLALYIVVYDDDICAELLCIYDFFGKAAHSSFDQQHVFGIGVLLFRGGSLALCLAEEFIDGKSDLGDDGFTIWDLSEVGKCVVDVIRKS